MTRAIAITAFYVLCAFVTACDTWEPVTCLPAVREPGVQFTTPATVGSQQTAVPTRLAIYLDATGSIRGFLANDIASAPESSYSRLIRELVDLPSVEPAIQLASAYKFGRRVQSVSWDTLDQARRKPGFYGDTRHAFNQKSRLDKVLVEIEAAVADGQNGDTLWIVGTDLVLTDKEDVGRNSRVVAPLARMLRGGLSIGVLAMKSRFKGRIYDLPFGNGMVNYDHDGYLGYYLLVIGKRESVDYLYRDYLQRKLVGGNDAEVRRFQVFSRRDLTDPIGVSALRTVKAVEMTGATEASEPLIAINEPHHMEIEFDRETPGVAVKFNVSKLLSGQGSTVPALAISSSGWYVLAPKGTCAERWVTDGDEPTGHFGIGERDIEFRVTPDEMAKVAPRDIHYKKADIFIASDVDSDNEQWYRSWSLSESRTPEVTETARQARSENQLVFFPTLNLATVYEELSHVEWEPLRGQKVGELAIAFRKK